MGIIFTRQKNGYCVEEVDRYIRKLSDEYQLAYNENQNINAKYDDLMKNTGLSRMKAEGKQTINLL